MKLLKTLPWQADSISHLYLSLTNATKESLYGFIWERNSPRGLQEEEKQSARFSYLGLLPKKLQIISTHTNTDPFAVLGEEWSEHKSHSWIPGGPIESPIIFAALSYDCAQFVEPTAHVPQHAEDPLLVVVHPSLVLIGDKLQKCIYAYGLDDESADGNQIAWILEVIENLIEEESHQEAESATYVPKAQLPLPDYNADSVVALEGIVKSLGGYSRYNEQKFSELVHKAKKHIIAGDVFQVVLSNEIVIPSPLNLAMAAVFLAEINPSPFHFSLILPELTLTGASPEVMLNATPHKSDDRSWDVYMRPIAGTYPSEIRHNMADIRSDIKEQAEHIMLVDHARNDIGRSARTGTVKVQELLCVEHYQNVSHLVSHVSGHLRQEVSPIEALRACFPIATLAGTPKVRAMQIIADLEQRPRGFFGGSVLFRDPWGHMSSTVIIRSLVSRSGITAISVGAGIVYDSQPEREYRECLWKAAPALAACCHRGTL